MLHVVIEEIKENFLFIRVHDKDPLNAYNYEIVRLKTSRKRILL